jgi:hypothetical protein
MDFFFDAASGRFSTAATPGASGRWGPAEMDPAAFTIIRTKDPDWLKALPELAAHRLKLDSKGDWLRENVYASGRLKAAPEIEWIVGSRWVNLSTGAGYESEEDAWADAHEGDTLFVNKSNDPACPGVALIVTDLARRTGAVLKGLTLEATETAAAKLAPVKPKG